MDELERIELAAMLDFFAAAPPDVVDGDRVDGEGPSFRRNPARRFEEEYRQQWWQPP